MIRRYCGLIGLLLLCGLALPAFADTAPATAAPNPDSPASPHGTQGAGAPDAGHQGGTSAVSVGLDPETLWRPRGTEVRFIFSFQGAGAAALGIKSVNVTFGWSRSPPVQGAATAGTSVPVRPTPVDLPPIGSPLVRNIPTSTGVITYGAVVPNLAPADADWWSRWLGHTRMSSTGVYTVPVADMRVIASLSDGSSIDEVLPVGITSLPAAFAVLGVSLLAALSILWRWGPLAVGTGPSSKNPAVQISRHALAVISSPDGVASLSQFQIMLWTFVVFGASVYVMVLSGNLIGISNGTLVLLGIAGGTSVIARTKKVDKPTGDGQPYWAQLLVRVTDDGAAEIDVTRVQMLIFTLVSAAFVVIKVAVTYEIPEIPDNFLLLMGISNGVYIAGRQTTGSKQTGQ